MQHSLVLTLLILLLSSCATKKNLPERIFDLFEKQAKNFTDGIGTLDENVDSVAKLPQKFNVAIFFRPPVAGNKDWKWNHEDKAKIFSTMEGLKGTRITRIFELVQTGDAGDYVALRKMAAQQGADALLLVQGLAEVDSSFNPWAFSYLAVAPLLFAPGNDVSSAFVSQALLWDVKKSFVHLGVQSEGEWSMKRPAAFRQQERAITKSREESLQALSSKLKKNFQEVIL
ncbi:MAG TPA: hypothetical protein VNJ08_09550 [Bacteriovoracaceae bacterium]|nr:hypothetical protein [Bacteriovoracaceae bacterium]